jgi:nucleotide-binding universal stress UspA family protein
VEPEESGGTLNTAPVALKRILVALDASDHADRALEESVRLAASAGGEVTGVHAYAAKLHDRRFRQMEGGLPERYLGESEMEHQRVVHDDLITRGLNVISDSYHDAAAPICRQAKVAYRRLSPEGKNYRRVVEAAASGDFDVLAMGAVGLGAVPGGVIGTVCERVARRCPIDVLVIRDPARRLGDGPLVAALDGSPRAFGALKTALDLGRRLGVEVHAVAAYDPYFHYVAFNKISGVLSEEAGQQFRFEEQEQLHEEIIDSGIAKIYQSHLEIARGIAESESVELTCKLLDGKPYQAIARYVEEVGASLLLAGKTGIHADPSLDIGGNAENLLRTAACHVWLGQVTYTPPLEAVARETITWSHEAEERMERVPETARGMVRMALLRLAQEKGHTVITSDLLDEATRRFCPDRGGAMEPEQALRWSDQATGLITALADPSVAAAVRLRAEKHARREGAGEVTADHVRGFLEDESGPATTAAACPFADMLGDDSETSDPTPLIWTPEAEQRLDRVPEGFMRALTRRRIESFARGQNVDAITPALIDDKYAQWAAGSAKQKMSMAWTDTAKARIDRIPDFVRGMVILELERSARESGADKVTDAVLEGASGVWGKLQAFHSDGKPGFYE